MAPGPGRFATPSTATLPVFGMQKTAPSFAGCGLLSLRSPPAAPVSVMHRAVVWPNAPALTTVWLGQNCPVAFVRDAVPLVSGLRLTGRGAWNPASGGRQSMVVPLALADEHASPLSSPSELLTSFHEVSHVPEMQVGHGEALLPVMYTRDESGSDTLESPVPMLTVPPAFVCTTFRTHVV